jgi:nitrite reductase/ring-hydroxylating ferredoxin subunit
LISRWRFLAQQEAVVSEENTKLAGPDFAEGVPIADLAEGGMILGQVSGEAVLLARSGGALFAVGAECTHYHGPLAEGALVADTVRCPWHHACFSLRTGEAVRAPALSPVACWRVEEHDGRIYVREKLEPAARPTRMAAQGGPESVVIIGRLHRSGHDAERRRLGSLRPAQSLQGLSRRHGT